MKQLLEIILSLITKNSSVLSKQILILLDKLKFKNHTLGLLIIAFLTGLQVFLAGCELEFCQHPWLQALLLILTSLSLGGVGFRTTQKLKEMRGEDFEK